MKPILLLPLALLGAGLVWLLERYVERMPDGEVVYHPTFSEWNNDHLGV